MEILLTYKSHGKGSRDPYTALLPVGLGSLNALLRKEGHRSRIANLSSFSWQEIGRLLADETPALLGVSQFTHNRFESLRLARMAKEANPECFVVLGGPHATHRFREILSQNNAVDAVVLGEGEETFCELVRGLIQGRRDLRGVRGIAFRSGGDIVSTPPRPPMEDLDALPLAAACFDDALGVDIHRQLEFIITSRGCPASCSFCSSPKFWGKGIRFRSPRSIVDEIRYIRDRYGLIYFSIRDDTFTADRERVLEFCRLLLREKVYILWNCQSRVNVVDEEIISWMKRAGCECIQLGVESGSPRVLKALGKGITPEQVKRAAQTARRAGIQLSVYLIAGVPDESEDDLKQTLSLLDAIKAHDGQISPLAYYPGTRLYETGVSSGAVAGDLFEADRRDALYARSDPFVAYATETLLARLESVAQTSSFSEAEFFAQKKALGYCHATNIMAGEMYEDGEEWRKAEAEYREITLREPENPWGWLMLGELFARMGKVTPARQAFESLARCLPTHAPAFSYLGELSRLAGDYRSANKLYRQALSLDPWEETARTAVKLVGG
jgi:anaerobic magnesium-protoporphyrin IX monomethyl ester cyclase